MKTILILLCSLGFITGSVKAQEIPESDESQTDHYLDGAEQFFRVYLFRTPFVKPFSKLIIKGKDSPGRTILLKKELYRSPAAFYSQFKIPDPADYKSISSEIDKHYPAKKSPDFLANLRKQTGLYKYEFHNYIFRTVSFSNDSIVIRTDLNEEIFNEKSWISKFKITKDGLISGISRYNIEGSHNDTILQKKLNFFYIGTQLTKTEEVDISSFNPGFNETRQCLYDSSGNCIESTTITYNYQHVKIERVTTYTYERSRLTGFHGTFNKTPESISCKIDYNGNQVEVTSYNHYLDKIEDQYSYLLVR